jgi:hypothetical protein
MDRFKLDRIRERLNSLRGQGGIKPRKVEALARALGRTHHKRGKEPTWINKLIPELQPLTIPHHSGDLSRFTASSILDQLEGDIDKIEEFLKKDEGGKRR